MTDLNPLSFMTKGHSTRPLGRLLLMMQWRILKDSPLCSYGNKVQIHPVSLSGVGPEP